MNQEFLFEDFPTIRHCLCLINVIDELPIVDVAYLLINDTNIDPIDKSLTYNAQVLQDEEYVGKILFLLS